MKKVLISRFGAYGDSIILTPMIRELKKLGYYVVINTSERGFEVLKNNPNIDEFISYNTNSLSNDELDNYWKDLQLKHKPDYFINLTHSIEVTLCTHPDYEIYYASQEERTKQCNKNYYEQTFSLVFDKLGIDTAEMPHEYYKPELYYNKRELSQARSLVPHNKYTIVICLSGSSISKFYPWNIHLVDEIKRLHPDSYIITIGDKFSISAEEAMAVDKKLSDRIPFKVACAMLQYADLLIAPDTGILHASACYNINKIALLGQTSIENITKHFSNCYSIQADCNCSPCFKIIYDNDTCPKDQTTQASLCMGYGISPFEILSAIEKFRSIV